MKTKTKKIKTIQTIDPETLRIDLIRLKLFLMEDLEALKNIIFQFEVIKK